MDSNSFLNNRAIKEFCLEMSEIKKIKDDLNKLYTETYNTIINEYELHELINMFQCIADKIDDKQLFNHLNEIQTILLLLNAYNNLNQLTHIPAPVVFSRIHKNISEILLILEYYKDQIREDIDLVKPKFFSFNEEIGYPENLTFTIHLSILCERATQIRDNIRKLVIETAQKANKIIRCEEEDE